MKTTKKPRKRVTDEEIIAAILMHGSNRAAAEALGIGEKTVYLRTKTPAYIELFRQTKQELLSTATHRLQAATVNAVKVLCVVMQDYKVAPQTRVNAATSVLAYAAKYAETVDIMERITELERSQK